MRGLRLGQLERPYFIAYRAYDARSIGASATGGSLLSSGTRHSRNVGPEVRVGDYAFDNTNFMNFGSSGMLMALGGEDFDFGAGSLPLDDSYLEFRRQVWLMTDMAYKHAAETYAEKRAALLNHSRRDSLPDFSRVTPTQTIDTTSVITLDRAEAESLVRALSAVAEFARLDRSSVRIGVDNTDQYLLNSEGTSAFVRRPQFSLTASASTQATDGAPLGASFHVYGHSLKDLPSREELARDIRTLALHLDSLRSAPVLEHYSGPVLFEGRAAAELFAERFAPALVGRRTPQGSADFAAMMDATGRGATPLSDRVRSRVLPNSMTVVDDPTLTTQDGVPLLGTYRVDNDGVPARRTVLIERGIVKQVLTTRVPVRGFLESTGNRRGDGAAPSNIVVTTTNGVSDAELKNRLVTMVKDRGLDYGLIVRELGSGAVNRDDPSAMMSELRGRGAGRLVLLAYRVYPDGREELVRGARLLGVSAESFKDIVAVSGRTTVLHRPTIAMGAFPFSPPMEMLESLGDLAGESLPLASYVVPSLLFEDVSLERSSGEQPRPPLSPPPGR
ncbi:MAG TPA: metallopeptidase TldD-related protein [Gemmatimonadaceae bacterium]|jgi:predicted Zn-dependent protease